MRLSTTMLGVASLLLSSSVFAAPKNEIQTVIAPNCLLENSSAVYQIIGQDKSYHLIQATPHQLAELVLEAHQQVVPCGKYLDVTPEWQSYQKQSLNNDNASRDFLAEYAEPASINNLKTSGSYTISHQTVVNKLLSDVKVDEFWGYLTELSDTSPGAFPDRSAYSDNGLKATHWLKDKVLAMAKKYGREGDVTATQVKVGKYCYSCKQESVVIKINGTTNKPGVVIGAHMDTLGSEWSKKPGADDDGTGSVTVLETARVLLESNQRFERPVYLIWYAAEERGLLGSKAVVDHFKAKQIPVKSVLHLDMTGFENRNDKTKLWLMTDNVNNPLTDFVEQLSLTYAGVNEVGKTRCGYACSDHASWTRGGFASAMPSESKMSEMNHDIHTSRDTMKNLSKTHMLKFAKLAVAFVGESADPVA